MINLAAALRKRKLAENNSSSNSNFKRVEQGCFLDGYDLVLVNILKRLPVECLMKCKSVCRRWRYLIKHDKYLIDSHHFTSSETRLRTGENTILMFPTRSVNGSILIKRFSFCNKDLRFDDCQGRELSDPAAVVTSNNVTLDQKWISMLEPVQGLVCFVCTVRGGVFDNCRSVLVYNPSTGVKTPWINASTSEVFKNFVGAGPVRSKTDKYIFGFGIDPTTNQHKVICIYQKVTRIELVIVRREFVSGVFTVGTNTWRKIDKIPHDSAISQDSVHVRGSIYWISDKDLENQNGIIMVFDVGSETFRLITIPSFILDLWSSTRTTKLVHELAEVDGRLAILVREGENTLHIWICNSDTDDDWIEETMQLPCRWDDIHNIAFKIVPGTNLVVLKISKEAHNKNIHHCEFLHYYDRRDKKYYGNQSVILWEPASTYGEVTIAPFYDTLLPV